MSMGRLGQERFGEPKHGRAVMCWRPWNMVWKQAFPELCDCWEPRSLAICLFLSSGTWQDKTKTKTPTRYLLWLIGFDCKGNSGVKGSREAPGSMQKCWDWLVMSARAQRDTLPPIDLASRDEGASLEFVEWEKGSHIRSEGQDSSLNSVQVQRSPLPPSQALLPVRATLRLLPFMLLCGARQGRADTERAANPEIHQLLQRWALPWLPQPLWSNGHLSS